MATRTTKAAETWRDRPDVVSRADWVAARKALLAKEKELTRKRDALSGERRRLPMVKVDKDYVFDAPGGKQTLADLFAGRSQLVVYHFMFGPGWEAGCPYCSFLVDHLDGALPHLEHHDVSVVVVSRAPLAEIEPFKKRMGWNFRWVSSYGTEFNYDYHVSFTKNEMAKGEVYYNYDMQKATSEELPGASVFYRDETGAVFHTYSAYARGVELLAGTFNYLDLTPKGRNETGPHFDLTDWVKYHDRY